MNQHLSEVQLERFLARRLSPTDDGNAARHLLAGCRLCGRKLLQMAPSSYLQKAVEEAAGTSLRDRVLASALRQETQQKVEQERLALSFDLLRESHESAGPVQRAQVESGPELVESLLRQSFELRFRDPQAMRWLAYNAVQATESLPPEEYSSTLRSDLQARAWAELANAYRINGNLLEAAGAFERSRASLRQGSGDLRLLARLANLEASFRIPQGTLTEASQLLDRVYRLYMRLGDRHLAGRALISLGVCIEYQGQSLGALQILQQGLHLLDPDRDPSLRSIAQISALSARISCGNYRQAGELLLKSGLRQAFASDQLNLLRIRWSEGKLMAGLNKLSRARNTLMGVRADFLDLGLNLDAAFVVQDLLPLLQQQGKSGEMRRIARESYTSFRELGVQREAARAKAYLV